MLVSKEARKVKGKGGVFVHVTGREDLILEDGSTI